MLKTRKLAQSRAWDLYPELQQSPFQFQSGAVVVKDPNGWEDLLNCMVAQYQEGQAKTELHIQIITERGGGKGEK